MGLGKICYNFHRRLEYVISNPQQVNAHARASADARANIRIEMPEANKCSCDCSCADAVAVASVQRVRSGSTKLTGGTQCRQMPLDLHLATPFS